MTRPLRQAERHDPDLAKLQRILDEVELGMLQGDAERVEKLLAQVEELLEPTWPTESGTWLAARST